MSLRSTSTRWFEILVAKEDLLKVVDALARSGKVQLEITSEITRHAAIPDLRDRMEEYNRLARRYQLYWPAQDLYPTEVPGEIGERMDQALKTLRIWTQDAEALIAQLEQLENEQTELNLLNQMLQVWQQSQGLSHSKEGSGNRLDFGLLAKAGPSLRARLYVLPAQTHLSHLPPAVLSVRAKSPTRLFLLAVGSEENMESLQRDMLLNKGRAVVLPNWLHGGGEQVMEQIQQRFLDITAKIESLNSRLVSVAQEHQLRETLGNIRQIEWFITHITSLPVSENFAWITGWTSDVSENEIHRILEQLSVRAVVHYPQPPQDLQAPMVMRNPRWSKPFEIFAALIGTPGENELDPSMLVALMVPVLFGYMFGDVGHGVVLFLIGVFFQKQYPVIKMLIPCGLVSMLFGFAFGSVFAFEGWIEPLWVSPVHEPLLVLFVPLGGGIAILLIGLMLNGIQSYWRGEMRRWLLVEAAVVFMYLSALASFVNDSAAWFFVVSAVWYFSGSVIVATTAVLKTLATAVGQLLESMFQLIINTVSFIRVGAFALAHAGLSVAVIVLMQIVDNSLFAAMIAVIGNIFIIVLEGLVVSIQTTRLVLFEFFIRFLRGSGRLFQPLRAPLHHVDKSAGEKHEIK
ncbi:MAG: hypothetical protein OEZ68_07815 [Gammaproteobacteria bacterium]|nr:hypothetical protein [Gammaproteobacteria bacterium]MDH5800692.1 hypothetical protein [Gammaproteobacteria bacterium]